MSAGVTWNQRNTGGHRSPLQRIRQLQTFQQPARFVRLGARHLVHIGTDIAEIIERRSVLTAAATDSVRWAASSWLHASHGRTGAEIMRRDPAPDVDSMTSSPLSTRTRSLIMTGPLRVLSSSVSESLPSKSKPHPLSSIKRVHTPAEHAKRTSTLRAPLCFRTFARAS